MVDNSNHDNKSLSNADKAETTSNGASKPSTSSPGDGSSEKKASDQGSNDIGSNPILKKIGRILTNSSGSDWRQGGFELGPEARVPRPIQVHEFVYVRDLPEHSLVVKAATPVNCQYAPGGYKLSAIAGGNYSIELRDRVFDPDKLVDPKFASNFKGKFVEVLATGEVAHKLFEDVRNLVKGSTRNLQREFDEKVIKLFDTILDSVERSEIVNWERTVGMVDGRDNTSYSTTHDGMTITILRSIEGWDAYFEIKVKQGKFEASRIGATPKLIFLALEKKEQENQIDSLDKKLKELGLSDE